MKTLLLKLYALTMCLLMGLAFVLIFRTSVWEAVDQYLLRVKTHDLVEFVTHGAPVRGCEGCEPAPATAPVWPQVPAAEQHFSLYDADAEVGRGEYRPAPPPAPEAELPLFVYKSLLAVLAAFLLFTHWRLFRNLRALSG